MDEDNSDNSQSNKSEENMENDKVNLIDPEKDDEKQSEFQNQSDDEKDNEKQSEFQKTTSSHKTNQKEESEIPTTKKFQYQNLHYIDEKDDPNDQSYDSVTDQNSFLIFDSEINFLKDITEIDVVFLIDTTGSMNPYIKGIKRFIRKIIFDANRTLTQYKVESFSMLKIGLAAYRDHDQEDESYVSKILCNLTDNMKEFRKSLYSLDAKGGKDECEAVLDGLDDATNNIQWRDKSMKFIYHICGSPGHGNDINCGQEDDYSDGCPCGKNHKDIIENLRGKGIEYTIIPLEEESMKNMIEAFSKFCKIDMMEPKFIKDEDADDSQ